MNAPHLPPELTFRPEFSHPELGSATDRAQQQGDPNPLDGGRSVNQSAAGADPGSSGTGSSGTEAPGQGPQPAANSTDTCTTQALIMGAFLVFMYLVFIRPQQRQEKQRKAMLAALKKNDRVVTSGGIHAVVASLGETDATLKIDVDGKVRVRVDRSAITKVLSDGRGSRDQADAGPDQDEGSKGKG
jgi:preprotein translocase subunit YajC